MSINLSTLELIELCFRNDFVSIPKSLASALGISTDTYLRAFDSITQCLELNSFFSVCVPLSHPY